MLESIISLSSSQNPAPSSTSMPLGEALALGGSVTLIGVLIVFAALVCLIFITWLYPKIALSLVDGSQERKKRRAERKALKAAVNTKEESVEKPVLIDEKPVEDTALIAAITAAISASMGTTTNGIIIKSLKRSRGNTPAWGREGRNEQVYNRF